MIWAKTGLRRAPDRPAPHEKRALHPARCSAAARLREAFEDGNWYQFLIPAAEALSDWPAIELTQDQVEAIRHGHRVSSEDGTIADGVNMVRGVSEQGELVALLEFVPETSEWQPKKVFFS